MYELRRVLVATGGSERGACAVVTGVNLARRAEARLDVVSVADTFLPSIYLPRARKLAIEEAMLQAARRMAEAQARQAKAVDPCFHILAGPPAPMIAGLAREISADVIVVGAHDRPQLERILLGSTLERVVRMAPCPVLAATTKRRTPFRRILAAVDFSPHAQTVVEAAGAIARTEGADFRILHVNEPILSMPIGIPTNEMKAAANTNRSLFERVITGSGSIPGSDPVERVGYAGSEILREAHDSKAQLVVIGSQGLGFFSRMIPESTSTYVLRHVATATIIVPKNHSRSLAVRHEEQDAV